MCITGNVGTSGPHIEHRSPGVGFRIAGSKSPTSVELVPWAESLVPKGSDWIRYICSDQGLIDGVAWTANWPSSVSRHWIKAKLMRESPTQRNGAAPVRQHANPGQSVPTSQFLPALYRYRWRAGVFFVFSLAVVIAGVILWPRKYTSEAKLLVRLGRSSVTLDPTVTTGHVIGVETSREVEINSALEVLNSRIVREMLIDKVGADVPAEQPIKTPLEREQAIRGLKNDLEIWSPKKTSVISLAYEASSPERAQTVVDELMKIFLKEHLRVNSTPRSLQFFEEQAAGIKKQLDERTREVKETKDKCELASITGRRGTLERQIGEVEQQAINTVTELSASRARIAALAGQLTSMPDPLIKRFVKGHPADATNRMREELFRLQIKEQELRSKYTDEHPTLIAFREQVRRTREILAAEQPDRGQATSAVLLTEQLVEEGLTARRETIENNLGKLNQQLKTLNAQEVEIVDLEREVQFLETKYRTYVQSTEQTRIARELEQQQITNISVIQHATQNVKASSPRKALSLLIGGFFSVVGSLSLVMLSNRLNTTLRSVVDVEEILTVPVLVTIPKSSRDLSTLRVAR